MKMAAHQHPTGLDLLHFADGEMTASDHRGVEEHLRSCWQCRTALEQLEQTVAEAVRYRQRLHTYLPSPPAPWSDLAAELSRIDATAERASFFSRLLSSFRQVTHWSAYRWAIPATLAAVALTLAVVKLRQVPSVEAAQLLERAALSEQARPQARRTIRIRTSRRQLDRPVGRVALDKSRETVAAEQELTALFAAAHYDWDDPLSVHAFNGWREQLPAKHDTVETLDGGVYRVQTTTPSGEVLAASLTLRGTDYRPVETRLEFRNREWVEITELAMAAPAPAPVAELHETTAPKVAAVPAPAVASTTPAGPADELRVVAALHRMGADLGDPVEVSRLDGHVLVSGIGIAPARQQQIREALETMPGVVVQFAEPGSPPGNEALAQTLETPHNAEGLRFQARIERQLGGRAQFEQFSAQLLELNEAALARAYALRRLAHQFPPETSSQMTASDRELLRRLGHEHAQVFSETMAAMEKLLTPVLVPLGGSQGAVQQNLSVVRTWQPATEDLFRRARRVETLLASMLDSSPKAAGSAQLPSQLLSSVAQLRATLDNYGRLLDLEPGGAGK